MLKKFISSIKKRSEIERGEVVDPGKFDDPIAGCTEWFPVKEYGKSDSSKYNLKLVYNSRAAFCPSITNTIVIIIFLASFISWFHTPT